MLSDKVNAIEKSATMINDIELYLQKASLRQQFFPQRDRVAIKIENKKRSNFTTIQAGAMIGVNLS